MIRHRQQGVALIYILVLFGLMTVVASRMTSDLLLQTEKNIALLERQQARHYAYGGEQYVALLLEEDFQEDKKKKRHVDHPGKSWYLTQSDFEADEGRIEITVVDEHSRLNTNSLLAPKKVGENNLQIMTNLFTALEVDPMLAQRVKDWVERDKDPNLADLEQGDDKKAGNQKQVVTSDTMMASVSEMRLLDGVDETIYRQVMPYLSTLPVEAVVNINTASPEVIRALSDKLSEVEVKAIIDGRGKDGYASRDDVLKLPQLKGKTEGGLKDAAFDVSSRFFRVYVRAEFRDSVFQMQSRLVRNSEGKVEVAERIFGSVPDWALADRKS
ncbi:type II secretion system minor pseudopilin GspK [Spongorhabdus nitratireducens]